MSMNRLSQFRIMTTTQPLLRARRPHSTSRQLEQAITLRDETTAGNNVEYLHTLRQLDQELGVAFEMMNFRGIIAGEFRHRLHALPIRDCHELAFGLAIFAEHLHVQSFFFERLDAVFV